MNPPIVHVEKMRGEGGEFFYRLRHFNDVFETTHFRHESEEPDFRDRLEYEIRGAVHQIFRRVIDQACEELARVYEAVGDYDTEAYNRTHDPVEFDGEMATQSPDSRGMRGRIEMRAAELAVNPPINFNPGGMNYAGRDRRPVTASMLRHERPQDKIEERAWELLVKKIGKAKFKKLNDVGYFEEKGKYGTYQFYKNDSSGVRFIQSVDVGGKKRPLEWTLCIQSAVASMPRGDVILSRWMEMKADEDKFQKTANWRDVKTKDEAVEPSPLDRMTRRTRLPMGRAALIHGPDSQEAILEELGIDSHTDRGRCTVSNSSNPREQWEVYRDHITKGNQEMYVETDVELIDASPDPQLARFLEIKERVISTWGLPERTLP